MSKFKNLIKGKKVLLLGPASHILNPENTSDFKNFDVIVKLNKMVEKASFSDEELNNRNDILYHCLQIDLPNGDLPYSVETWKSKGVKHLRIPFTGATAHYRMNINRFIKSNLSVGIEFSTIPIDVFNQINIDCDNTLPSTGILAISDLLLQEPEILHIRGLTFGRTGYSKEYKNDQWHKNKDHRKRTTKHNLEKQILLFKRLYKNSDNIVVDNELKEVLDNE